MFRAPGTRAPNAKAPDSDPSAAKTSRSRGPAARDPDTAQGAAKPPATARAPSTGDLEAAGERIAKVLARAGVASRREVERLIEAGKVTLNGALVTSPAINVRPGDQLAVEGRPVGAAEATRLFRYHKPAGLLTSHDDPRGRATVFAALPAALPRLISIGRLDLNSEGLLLLTNDGELSRALELPSGGWTRRYRARAWGRIDQARLDTLKEGITVEGVRYGPIEATLDKAREGATGANLWITLTLAEGKNREVRRVLEALGLTVNRLIRLAYGPFALGTLAQGAIEEVGPRVIREQLDGLVAPASMPTGDRALYKAEPAGAGRRAATAKARAAEARAAGEAQVPITYKPGWARPKKKVLGPGTPMGRTARDHKLAGAAPRKARPPARRPKTPEKMETPEKK